MRESFLYQMATFAGGFMGGIIVENMIESPVVATLEASNIIPPILVRPVAMVVFGVIGGLISVRLGSIAFR